MDSGAKLGRGEGEGERGRGKEDRASEAPRFIPFFFILIRGARSAILPVTDSRRDDVDDEPEGEGGDGERHMLRVMTDARRGCSATVQ